MNHVKMNDDEKMINQKYFECLGWSRPNDSWILLNSHFWLYVSVNWMFSNVFSCCLALRRRWTRIIYPIIVDSTSTDSHEMRASLVLGGNDCAQNEPASAWMVVGCKRAHCLL